ncbi:hypothetical protein TNCV_3620361 [Trichonephila clavipes]|nr:hypothetical protein TNCV_3620361 [Trichonephila clavipes]
MGTGTKEIKAYFSSGTLAEWRQFVNEVILDQAEKTSEKIGGKGKIVEVDESKFGKDSIIEDMQWRDSGYLEVYNEDQA